MEHFFIGMGVSILFLMLCNLYRVVAGPTVIDRILGVNVIGIKTTVLIILLGTIDRRVEMYIDIALGYALLNFITTIAVARFYQRIAPTVNSDKKESLHSASPSALIDEGAAVAGSAGGKGEIK
ncbi:MAG: pH regulation protein F [Desulfamplus sp.]|nr:pH regulation protein F [Desulfamplus sp.]